MFLAKTSKSLHHLCFKFRGEFNHGIIDKSLIVPTKAVRESLNDIDRSRVQTNRIGFLCRGPKLVGGISQRCEFFPAFFGNLRLAGMVRLEIGKDFLFLIVKIKLFRMFFKLVYLAYFFISFIT
jgi:hypothetical protein